MLTYLLLVALPLVTQPLPAESLDSRIIKGNLTVKGHFPWQAALFIDSQDGDRFCGGSLVSPNWILTAAQCTDRAVTISIKLGITELSDTNETSFSTLASEVLQHPNFDASSLINDIALVYFSKTVISSNNIRPIKIASSALADGTRVLVCGWGKTSDETTGISQDLRYIELVTMSSTDCALIYGTAALTGGIVCAKGATIESTCLGDNGGPMMSVSGTEPVLVGIISLLTAKACAIGKPTGYTRVAPYRKWIIAQTGPI